MASRGHFSRTSRRIAFAAVGALAVLAATPVGVGTSHADSKSTITVVGTSDVYDSDLIQKVIKPDFEKAYPQYTLNYVSLGTGAAISYAEAGTASALLVHAASLENSFVTPGGSQPSYSAEEAGRAIFYGDYVLLGPSSDPAHVMVDGNASHDIVSAYDKILQAGQLGNANYVSRGGTPGTTVEEHSIWALDTADDADFCDVTSANGLGAQPSTTDQGTDCPGTATPPSWYHITGLTQGPNVVNADACNYNQTNGDDCYVLTDRGTYLYLQSMGALHDLQVVAEQNSSTAVGGENLLINSFHAYAINPAAFASNPNVHINLPGALAFLNWLTSKQGQADVSAYQENLNNGHPTFKGDAVPALTAKPAAKKVTAGTRDAVTGSLRNIVPGAPPMAGVALTLTINSGGTTKTVSGQTGPDGKYSFPVTPTATATYSVAAGGQAPIFQVENSTLSPKYSDLLQPTSVSAGTVTVVGAPTIKTLTPKKGVVTIKGTLAPAVSGSGAELKVYANTAANVAAGKALTLKLTKALKAGATTFTEKVTLKRGKTWKVDVKYLDPGLISTGASAARSVHVN